MNKLLNRRVAFLLGLCLLSATAETTQAAPAADTHKPGHPAINTSNADAISGTVIETMDAGGYTYVQIDTGKEKIWAAGPTTPVKTGARVTINPQMPMANFHSKALDRDFKVIYFTGRIITDSQSAQAAARDPHADIGKAVVTTPIGGITKAENGKTIAEIFQHKQSLKGETVRVRGQVLKFTSKVLGKNWVHLQDGSSKDKLVITTNNEAKIGDIVLAKGKLSLDKDLGHGYRYDVILEDALITVEQHPVIPK